jgi:hypothetical protein
MKLQALALFFTASQTIQAMEVAPDERSYGQYICRVEHAVGFRYHDKEAPIAGSILLPDSELTFGVTIDRINRTEADVTLCKRSFEHFLPMIEHGVPYKSFDAPKDLNGIAFERRSVGAKCLAKDKAILTSVGDERRWNYTSYDYPSEFYGLNPADWFSLYGDGSFRRSFPYDSGPVLTEGRCAKMPSTK